jgi:hypothetical protein
MPPIFLHMAVARDVAAELPGQAVLVDDGSYLLGATSPDIRVITRWERERTHFFDLADMEHQDSVGSFLAACPDLDRPERLSAETRAFVGGYITHLSLDQTWIEQVYRPYFGQLSSLGGDLSANTMDRLLQFELDRRRRQETGARDDILEALAGSSLSIDVGFLDSEILRKWQQVALDQASHDGDWERFRSQASRHLRDRGLDSPEEWERFRAQIPEMLERTIDHVSTAEVDAFVERGKERALTAVRQYLRLDR